MSLRSNASRDQTATSRAGLTTADASARRLTYWVDQDVVQRQVAEYSAGSVAAALRAACSSPGAVHRLPGLAALWVATWAEPPFGNCASEGIGCARRDNLG